MRVDSSLRPFERKTFFLDLHGYPQEASLIKNLKLLGARHEPVFSKYVSFVVSNRVPLKTTAIIHQRPYSPLTPKSTGMCPSPQLFSECSADYLESSPYSISLSSDPYPPSPKVQSRGMALLKKATQKAKENQRATDLLENCKRWGIKVYHVEKILPKVKKYTNLIAAQYAKQKDQKKKDNEKKEEYPSHVKKLLPPFIKFEDKERKFKPIFQEFTSWTEVIDSSLSRNINQLNKQFKRTGDLSDVSRSVFAEININTSNKNLESSRIYSLHADESRTKSFTKLTENLKPSNCTSVQVSTSILPLDTEKENTVQVVKNKKHRRRVKSKSPYCEICHKNYIDLDEHIKTEKHRRFMSNPINFLAVQNIITSLPKKGDDLLYKSYLIEEGNHFSFPGSCQNTEILDCNNVLYQPEIVTDVFDPVFDIHDLPTEPYSFIDPEFVSPSCSSPDLVPLPFLHDSGEECSEKPSSHRNETCNNILDFSMEKNSDFKPEIPPVSSNVAFLQNATANTNNIMCNDITLPNDLTTVDMVDTLAEGNRCQEESVQENQISLNEVTDAPENVFTENYLHTKHESYNNAKPFSLVQPLVGHLSICNQNNLPEESLNTVPEKENCDLNLVLKDETNDNIKSLLEIQPNSTEAQVENNSVNVSIHGQRKNKKRAGTEISGSSFKQKRRKVASKRSCNIKKRETDDAIASVPSCNSNDYICKDVSSVQINLLSEVECPVSEEICDSEDSAIVIPSNDIYLKTVPTSQNNTGEISESVSETFQICSELDVTFEKLNSIDSTIKRMNSGSDTESLLHSQIEFISEEICDSQDSAIVVPLKDTHSKILTTFQNISENIPESVSGAFQICSETALAFEMNPNDCKKRRNIEHDLSDSEDLNNNMCHEMFQNSVVDSGIDMLTPFLMNSTLDTSFEKFAERDTNSLINFNNNCSLDASVNNCFSANYYTSNIDHPFQSKDMSSRLEDISTDLCPAEAETSVSCIYEDTLNRKVHFMEDPDLELFKSASQITVCSEQNEKVVSVLINGFNYKDGILNDQLSCAPMLSLYSRYSYLNNTHHKCNQLSGIGDYNSSNFVDENKEASLEMPCFDFNVESSTINNFVYNLVSVGDQTKIVQKTKDPETEITDLENKIKSKKCTDRKQIQDNFTRIFLSDNKHFPCIYENKLQLLHISGIEFHECLFICSLSKCISGSQETSAAGNPKFQECLISVDSTIKISSNKQNLAYYSLDSLKESYSNKGRWNLLLVKMEDLKLESGFIGLILEKCQGKALISVSSMGNKNSVSKNFTTQPKPSSPVYCTILYPYQDTKICDYFGNKNICRDSISSASSKFICDVGMKNLISTKDETIRSLADNSSEAVCRKSLIVNQPLNLCTKESEQMDLDPQTFCEFPQLNPCLTDNIGNLASYSPLQSSAKLSFDECCSYERIAKQLIQASSNLQYIEPISVCSSDCDVDCCKPCTCDLGGGKCIPQTCNNFQYIETNSMDSSDNECILPNKEITPNCNLSKFLNNSVLEFKNNSISGDTYETSPLSPLYVVIDDADCDSDDDWNSIKSEVDSVCREFCHNEQY